MAKKKKNNGHKRASWDFTVNITVLDQRSATKIFEMQEIQIDQAFRELMALDMLKLKQIRREDNKQVQQQAKIIEDLMRIR